MKWSRYDGIRICKEGWRTSVEVPPTQPYGPTSRRYGYVWSDEDGFRGYYEINRPGEVEDVEVGPFTDLVAARAAVEEALSRSGQS